MNVKTCYEGIGDYERMAACFRGDEKIKKFLGMFLQDDNYEKLKDALEKEDVDTAFIAAHTLKGVCKNLALDPLLEADIVVTEALRGKDLTKAKENFPAVEAEYQRAYDRISQL